MKKATTTALIISILLSMGFIVLLFVKRAELGNLTLNEWGDFLAGFAAPLAFVWLVAGYLQQGRELQLNTAALKEQQAELRLQVEATKQLSEHANRQAESSEKMAEVAMAEMESLKLDQQKRLMAYFHGQISSLFEGGNTILITLISTGAIARNVEVYAQPNSVPATMQPQPLVKFNDEFKCRFKKESLEGGVIGEIEIRYVDMDDNHRSSLYYVDGNDGSIEVCGRVHKIVSPY